MALGAILIGTVIPAVVDEIFSAYKEKYVTTGIKKLLFEPQEYSIELNKIIINTIEKYQKIFPPTGNYCTKCSKDNCF